MPKLVVRLLVAAAIAAATLTMKSQPADCTFCGGIYCIDSDVCMEGCACIANHCTSFDD